MWYSLRASFRSLFLTSCVLLLLSSAAFAQTIARCGEGWLEEINGYPVLHLKGTPWEMGYQHGVLMREHVRENMHRLLNVEGDAELVSFGPISIRPRDAIKSIIAIQRPHVSDDYMHELAGLAAGAELPLEDVRITNFIPELFHCSGFALTNEATADGTLYHGRVLDYAINWGLQDHAVVIVAEPEGKHPFVNISYAGFVGSVTGMNAQGISIGEMGGRGLGHWNGVPMALLMRRSLEECDTLDEVIDLFRNSPRTCEYFYVVADGNAGRAVGMEASWDVCDIVEMGTAHELLPEAVADCALLSAGDRYTELVKRVRDGWGTFTAESALKLMDRPVAMKSNLHNVLFAPKTGHFWVANASSDGKPAAEQPYHAFHLPELLSRHPDDGAPMYDLPPAAPVARGESPDRSPQ